MQRTGGSVGEMAGTETETRKDQRGWRTERMEVGADGVPLGVIPCVIERGDAPLPVG